MNKYSSEATKILKILCGQSLSDFGYAADMIWIGFGNKDIPFTKINGNTVMHHRYCLHIQCDWAFKSQGNVLFTNEDWYKPDDVCFDEKLTDYKKLVFTNNGLGLNSPIVDSVEVDDKCELTIKLSNEVLLKTQSNRITEEWRFIDSVNKYHYVFWGKENHCEMTEISF